MMRFTRKKNLSPMNNHLDNKKIKSMNTQKDLGIYVIDDLK
jgi:hypothetical protein